MPKKYSEILAERRKEKELKKKDVKQQKEDPEYVKKEKSINFVIKDGFFTSLKVGFTESFIMPFAIAMNASTEMLAALASIPQLVANFFQVWSEESLQLFKTRSKLIFWTALIQAFIWIPLLLIPFLAKDNMILLLLLVTVEATLGAFSGPIYNSILGDLISDDKRGEFFGNRNRVINLVNFLATFVAGMIINFFQKIDNGKGVYVFIGFAILFFVAFLSRVTAALYKRKIYDPEYIPQKKNTSFLKFMQNMTHDNYGIFVMYVLAFKMATAIAIPFFALYLLKDLQLGYLYFTIIMAVSIAASFFAMSGWGKMIDRHGSKRVLTIAGFFVPLSPILMILAIYIKNPLFVFLFLLAEEIFSGVAWAAFNLSTSAFLFDATTPKDRVKNIAYYNFLVGIGIFLGAVLGGLLIKIYPVWITSSIPFILLTSGVLRMLATIFLIKKVREARMVEIDFPGRGFFHSAISINPRFGSNIEIIGVYEEPKHKQFHNILPKRKPVDPVKKEERKLYQDKSLELYRKNAIKTLMQKQREETQRDDSYKIGKDIEKDNKKISDITEDIRKKNIK